MDSDPVRQGEATAVIADADTSGYNGVTTLAADDRIAVHLLRSGRDALRLASRGPSLIWLIGTHLEDMSGFDLHAMIRDRIDRAIVCMVTSQYRAEDEILAYQTGATMFLQKPVEVAAVVQHLVRRSKRLPPQPQCEPTSDGPDAPTDLLDARVKRLRGEAAQAGTKRMPNGIEKRGNRQ
jgi:DNA-binding response OmpR family regulator